MALVVGEKLATLQELETIYTFEDALNMAEVVIVRNHNEWLVMEYGKNKQ